MGVVNVTPDSFSDGGLYLDPGTAIAHGEELAAQGPRSSTSAVSRRGRGPRRSRRRRSCGGSSRWSAGLAGVAGADLGRHLEGDGRRGGARRRGDDRQRRHRPARRSGDGGAGRRARRRPRPHAHGRRAADDAGRPPLRRRRRRGPRLPRRAPRRRRRRRVDEERIWLDPGIGFGKTAAHNFELLRGLPELAALGRPLVVGTSRKSFIGRADGSETDARLGGTIATSVLAAASGAAVLRVHDVREMAPGADGGERGARIGSRPCPIQSLR